MRFFPAGLFLLFLSSCFLFRDFHKKEFSLPGQGASVEFIVPRGYVEENRFDTAGISLQSYRYPGGGLLYVALVPDSNSTTFPFDTTVHYPLDLVTGGTVYKGQDSTKLFFREIRQGNFRYGYRNVPWELETLFDSATNYPAWRYASYPNL